MLQLVALLFVMSSSYAVIPESGVAYRFTPVEDALQVADENQKSIMTAAKNASFLLDTDDGRCTATYTSHDGRFLTARHCLQSCIIKSKLMKLIYDSSGISYFVLVPEKLGKATCDVQINKEKVQIVIDATSPGIITKSDEASFDILNPEVFGKLVDEGFTSRGDFVFGHVVDAKSPTSCLPLSQSSAKPGEFVQYVGYPGETERPDGFNSDGVNATASGGHIIAKIEDNKCFMETTGPQALVDDILRRFNESTTMLSTLDTVFGASGSSVVNMQGEIAGVLSNVYRHSWLSRNPEDAPEVRYCEGSSKALRMEQILTLTAAQGSVLKSQNCD